MLAHAGASSGATRDGLQSIRSGDYGGSATVVLEPEDAAAVARACVHALTK